jgi:hypothetical protein
MSTKATRPRPAIFLALGRAQPPPEIVVGGETYALDAKLKHDSWAATAIYVGSGGRRIICKFNRTQNAFGIPLRWIGRWLARREAGFLRRLADLENVPNELGPVSVGGVVLRNACARSFIEGEPFSYSRPVDAEFFRLFRQTLDRMHAAGMAYVDLHKCENVIVDVEGRPHFVDFQVCYGLSNGWPGNGPIARYFLRKLQEMDDYHYRKHVLRALPGMLTEAERQEYATLPPMIRAHRRIAVPLRTARRRLLTAIGVRGRSGKAQTELEPEVAFRDRQDG